MSDTKSKRRCENWLLTFRDWTLPRSEAKETFIFFTGLFSLASALRRRVVLPKTMLGSWEVYPYLYIFFISPPGRGRKTTTMSYADDLLDEIPTVTTVAQACTQQDLMKKISDLSEPSISIRALEFGTFYKPSGDVMIDFLTALFDGRKRFDSSTLTRGLEFASKPCCNLLAATTPGWISDNMSEGLVGGGFMSRTIPIFEDTVRRRQLYYEELNHKALGKLRDDLVVDLNHLATNIEGEFKIDDDAKFFSQSWYRSTADKYEQQEDARLHGYYERKPAYAFKLAMLIHLAYSDELIITLEDFQKALAILQSVEKKMLRAYAVVGKNPYTEEMDAIVEFISERGKVEKTELLGRFYHSAEPEKLLQLVAGLVAVGKLDVFATDPRHLYYQIAKNHKREANLTESKAVDPTHSAPSQSEPLQSSSETPQG